MNINIQNIRGYNINLYLEIFERLHNVEPIEEYNDFEQDNEYYKYYMNVFIEHMRELLSNPNTREEFNRIMIRILNRSRGQSVLKTRVLREIMNMDEQSRSLPPSRMNIIGGSRRYTKRSRKAKKSRKIKYL